MYVSCGRLFLWWCSISSVMHFSASSTTVLGTAIFFFYHCSQSYRAKGKSFNSIMLINSLLPLFHGFITFVIIIIHYRHFFMVCFTNIMQASTCQLFWWLYDNETTCWISAFCKFLWIFLNWNYFSWESRLCKYYFTAINQIIRR